MFNDHLFDFKRKRILFDSRDYFFLFGNNLHHQITCRLGSGLSTVKKDEVQVAIIAGMGGNLIRDILEADLDVVKQLEYMILQPVQNAEVLREYLCNTGYDILDEEICYEDGKFYETNVSYTTFMPIDLNVQNAPQ